MSYHPTAPDNLTQAQFWGGFYQILFDTVDRCERIMAENETKTAPVAILADDTGAADQDNRKEARQADNNTITGQGQSEGRK